MAECGIVSGAKGGRSGTLGLASSERIAARVRTELALLDPSLASIASDPASAHWLGRLLAEVERLLEAPESGVRSCLAPHDHLGR